MATLNIVMVEPEIPQNTGNVARTCAATGARLHLVGPMGFQIDDKKLKRAGLDYWHMLDITMYSSLSDFFEKNPLADQTGYYFSTKAQHTHTDMFSFSSANFKVIYYFVYCGLRKNRLFRHLFRFQ